MTDTFGYSLNCSNTYHIHIYAFLPLKLEGCQILEDSSWLVTIDMKTEKTRKFDMCMCHMHLLRYILIEDRAKCMQLILDYGLWLWIN